MASDEVDGLSPSFGFSEAFSDPSTKHLAEFPKELKTQPVALVSFHGLNVGQNDVHAAIWEAFQVKNDAAPINCVLRPSEYQFPAPKQKKQGYDRYVPHGIWKRNWLKKHLDDVPAVAVIFCDLDFRASNWPERRDSCVSMVHCLKVALMGRDTRLAVVLIQQTPPVPGTSDDATTTERVAALCSLCNVSNKSLFVLSYSDHLKEYTARLQSALFELSQSYYQGAARRVKAHRDTLNETVHQALFVRHPFKMGFFHEMKHDVTGAIKLYQQAYGNLLKLKLVDANCQEIKTVAGFLNYKTCQLLFKASLPRDAILQFKKHIEVYARKVGPAAVSFQHHAWMSQQFQVFAELFEQAISGGLPAVQTQHPGFYYQSAAYHVAIRRKESALHCQKVEQATFLEGEHPLKNEDTMQYFGQRPWRAGRSLLDPDPTLEAAGFAAIQLREAEGVRYPEQIITLLSSAMTQYKKFHSSRMKRHLMVQTADEFTNLKEFHKALTLLNHVIWDYRREKWWKLLSSLLDKALILAYVTVSRADFIRLLIEFLGPKFKELHSVNPSRRDELQECLDDVLNGTCPRLPLPTETGVFSDASLVEEVKEEWRRLLAKPCDQPISLDMTPIVGLWEVSCHFEKDSYSLDDVIRVGVHVRLHSPHPMSLDKLTLCINTSERQLVKSREDPACDAADFSFSSGEVRSYFYEFFAESEDVGKQLTLKELKLRIVGRNGFDVDVGHPAIVDLCWNVEAEASAVGVVAEQQAFQTFRLDSSGLESRCSNINSQAMVTPHASMLKMEVEHSAPALLSEWYPVKLSIANHEPYPVQNLTLKFALDTPEGFAEGVRIFVGAPDEEEVGLAQIEPVLIGDGKLEPEGSTEVILHVKMSQLDEMKFIAQVFYDVTCQRTNPGKDVQPPPANCNCVTSGEVKTHAVRALEATISPVSLKMEPVTKLFVDEPSLLILTLVNKSPWPVFIKETDLKLDASLFQGEEEETLGIEQIRELVLDSGEKASECKFVVPLKPFTPRAFASTEGAPTPAMATYSVMWNRDSERDLPPVNMVVPLPCPTVIECPLWLDFRSPSHGYLRSSVAIAYEFLNRLDTMLELSITVEASDAFMFSGQSQVKMKLMPRAQETLHYNLFPLMAGEVALPRMKIEGVGLPAYTPVFEALVHRSVPARLFIMVNSK